MTKLKPFQKATVEAVLNAFANNGSRHFLVADEVGLGKTVIAQEVIRRLARKKSKPLVVFYVCSSLSIASQNKTKLLEILPEHERPDAACPVDRLTLLPASTLPSHPKLHLYTLTPDTSIPIREGRRRDGRQEERALIHALVEYIWPDFFKGRNKKFFQRYAYKWWNDWVKYYRKRVRQNSSLCNAFRKSVREEFNLQKGQRFVPAVSEEKDDLKLIAKFRNALALSALDEIKPDLVIFDEFQRFRDLLDSDKDRAATRVISKLRGEALSRPPGLLLLSATPYRLFSRRWEDAQGNSHHEEFFDLVEFLYGSNEQAKQKRTECQAQLAELRKELHRGQPNSEEAIAARNRVEELLTPIVARTERASYFANGKAENYSHLPAELHPDDLKIYRHLSQSLAEEHRSSAVSYWTSIPLPMQTMGNSYITWRQAIPQPAGEIPIVELKARDRFKVMQNWPHPRLRAIKQELVPTDQLALPWMPPSLSWWSLRGAWSNYQKTTGKVLIFSRFRAVPQSVAAFLSYDLESTLMKGQKLKYVDATRRRVLQATTDRYNLLALFNPSPWLVESTDPLATKSQDLDEIKQHMQRQIRRALKQLGIPVRKPGKRRLLPQRKRPSWQLLGQIEVKAGHWPWINTAWWQLHQDIQRQDNRAENPDVGLGRLLQRWKQEVTTPLDSVTPEEVVELAEFALNAPGVVLGRALRRHWPAAVTRQGYQTTLRVVWNGLRNYLDQRWFFISLKSKDEDEESYPEAIRQAVIDGNLEAVLDEHLWIISQLRSLSAEALARELEQGLSLRTSVFNLHQADDKSAKTFTLRCHVALPFIQTQAKTQVSNVEDEGYRVSTLRADEIRKSFNSPFWPHVLATTSVGQEGLDFHVWCHSLVHWDLCSNPVDLEQREGRIQRFGGLAVRQAIAGKLGQQALRQTKAGESPWQRLGSLAEQQLKDDSGLAPWWVCEGAAIKRYIFDVPLSEQARRLEWVQGQRLLYRLVLGQPNQEDLVEIIARQHQLSDTELHQAMLQLSPWFNRSTSEL